MDERDEHEHGNDGILGKIYEATLAQGKQLGRFQGRFEGVERHLHSIDQRLDFVESSLQELGQATAIQTSATAFHAKKISDLYQRLDVTENTGMTHIAEERGSWKTWARVAAVLAALCTLVGTSIGIQQCTVTKQAGKGTGPKN